MKPLEMPKYRCHKEVRALKIKSIDNPNNVTDGSRLLTFEEAGYEPICVTGTFMTQHSPQVGGYYVVYADGYASYSPASAFEDGYTRIDANEKAMVAAVVFNGHKCLLSGVPAVDYGRLTISYERLCKEAGLSPDATPTVTYLLPDNRSGIVVRGQQVLLVSGAVYNVGITGSA